MARKEKKKRSGRERISQSQLQAYRARQESALSREEVEQRMEEERRRQARREEQMAQDAESEYADMLGLRRDEEDDDVPKLSPEQIAADYQSVNQELYRIALWGGLMFVLLVGIAFCMS